MKSVLITGIVVCGRATIFALAQGMPIQVAISTDTTTLAMVAGAGALKS